jgi:hypothetical protein
LTETVTVGGVEPYETETLILQDENKNMENETGMGVGWGGAKRRNVDIERRVSSLIVARDAPAKGMPEGRRNRSSVSLVVSNQLCVGEQ